MLGENIGFPIMFQNDKKQLQTYEATKNKLGVL
jgi:hypothetical protein